MNKLDRLLVTVNRFVLRISLFELEMLIFIGNLIYLCYTDGAIQIVKIFLVSKHSKASHWAIFDILFRNSIKSPHKESFEISNVVVESDFTKCPAIEIHPGREIDYSGS